MSLPDESEHPAGWTDEELCTRARAGESEAWGEVYRVVLRLCRGGHWRLGDRAEDVASGVVVKLLEAGLEQVREPGRFRSFLRRVAANSILDQLRSRGPVLVDLDDQTRISASDVENDAATPSPYVRALGREGVRMVLAAVEALGQPCHGLLEAYLRFRMGLIESYKELERTLGKRASVISVQVRRCLERLQRDPRVRELRGMRGRGG